MTNLFTIARLELVSASRLQWIRLLTAAFALLACAAAYSAGVANDLSGIDGFERTTMTLIPVVLTLVPIAALVLGVAGQSGEAGVEPFLYGQPIRRSTVLLGRWLGESAALSGAIAAGFAAGGASVALNAGPAGALRFAFFVAMAAVLGVIFLAIATAIASATDKRITALAVGTFAWFFFVLLYDAAALSLAGWITGSTGGRVLFGSVFGNPADLVRVAMLSVSGTPNVLGAAGDAWVRFLGGTSAAIASAAAALTLWTILPLAVGVRVINMRDL
jgi:Cu-processing system permease protein